MVKRVICGIALLAGLTLISATTAVARPQRIIDDNDRVVLKGNIHPHARSESDAGATDQSQAMERMVLSLKMPDDKQAELNRLLVEQQDPASPNFHRWLTPEQFGERFGADQEDLDAVTGWLTSRGFSIEELPRSRSWINFSGTVAGVERTFATRMRDYHVNGFRRHANQRDPEIPRGLADLVGGIVSLHSFPRKAMNSGIRQLAQGESLPEFTSGSRHYISPADFATIYNLNPLYSEGIDGSGQSIAIVGRTHPSASNWDSFRSLMGLPANPPQVIVNGPDPGDQGADENGEADLDVEWAGAVARKATIKFVVSASTSTTDGVDLSAQYIVDNNLAAVMSTSFGQCEALMGSAENAFYKNLWQQAAAQGITSFVASGDSGVAGCNGGSSSSASIKGVNGLASTPYNVAVGGTQFNEGSGTYWNSVNGPGYSSAIGYIPETAWNESATASGGSGLWSTGGGFSSIYSRPSWQVSPGVPAYGKRGVPDVSLTSAIHDGYLVKTQGSLSVIGGTSAASPAFAGIMALIVQKSGQRQGNANPRLYQIGNSQYGSDGTVVFHDIVSGNNSVPGLSGYPCTPGYDLSTGLGSVDAYALANLYMPTPIAPAITSAATATFTTSSPGTFTVSTTGYPTASLSTAGTLPAGVSFTDNQNGSATLAGTPASGSGGSYPVIITASNGIGAATAQTFILTVGQAPLITSAASTILTSGTAGTFTVSASGYPAPTLSRSGSLPGGMTFTNNGNGTATISGTPTSGITGSYPIVVSASNIYGSASQNLSLTLVSQAVPAVTWNNPADIGSRTPLGAKQLNATSTLAGTFSYSPPAGTFPGVGADRILTVTFTPIDLTNHVPVTKTVTIDVLACDGDFSGNGVIDVDDALFVLRTAVGLHAATARESARGDVAPFVNDTPFPDGNVDLTDALMILKKVVGLVNF